MKNLSYPLSTYGFSGGLNYKRFGISFNFYGVSQISKQVDGNLYWDLGDGNSGVYTASPDVIYTWTLENADIATKPVLHSDHRGYSMRANTTYLFQDASYLRLKNLELNYHISNKLIKDLGISKLQVYASGNNLITFTNYFKNIDPEQSGAFVYPIIKRYNLGVRLSF
jgi:hypothetical protein